MRRKMAGRLVCARMCPCAHIVGAHMLVGTVSKNGFSLLSKPWHHYWIILSLLLPSWCGIVHFGGRVQGSAARAFFARMCAGMAARPVCARMCLCAHTVGKHTHHMLVRPVCKLGILYDGFSLLGKLWQHYSIIYTYNISIITNFVVQDSAIWRQLAGICCARVFGAHVRRNGSASSMCAHVRAQFPSLESYDGF